MFLVGWKYSLGFVLEARYPKEIKKDSNCFLQYAKTFQILSKSLTIQVQDETQSTLVYGIL